MYDELPQEMNPDKVFEGLGLRNWLRLVFRTRAGLLKQSDRITDMLMTHLNAQTQDANASREALVKMAGLAVKQQAALQGVIAPMTLFFQKGVMSDVELASYTEAMNNVAAALTAANEEMKK